MAKSVNLLYSPPIDSNQTIIEGYIQSGDSYAQFRSVIIKDDENNFDKEATEKLIMGSLHWVPNHD